MSSAESRSGKRVKVAKRARQLPSKGSETNADFSKSKGHSERARIVASGGEGCCQGSECHRSKRAQRACVAIHTFSAGNSMCQVCYTCMSVHCHVCMCCKRLSSEEKVLQKKSTRSLKLRNSYSTIYSETIIYNGSPSGISHRICLGCAKDSLREAEEITEICN